MSSLDLATLFEKLKKHEMKLKSLVKDEEGNKRKKIAHLRIEEDKSWQIWQTTRLTTQKQRNIFVLPNLMAIWKEMPYKFEFSSKPERAYKLKNLRMKQRRHI